MYILNFTLKQHTPIIHFQHDQDGATLRATEVKPKLDRFILMNIGKNDYEAGRIYAKSNDWLIDKEKGALNYKLIIESQSSNIEVKIEKAYPNYLGNMGKTLDEKAFIFSDKVNVKFICSNNDLKKKINDEFSNFLTSTNFGTRKSKGFGCYSLLDNTERNFDTQMLRIFGTVFKLTWKNSTVNIFDDHKFLFRRIQDEYKVLKAGDSRSKKDSKLRQYVNNLDIPIEWEKPVIQTDIATISKKNLNIEWKNKNFHFVRAFLGLADHFEYKNENVVVNIKPKDENLQRFMSPILFKIFNNQLYIVSNPDSDLSLLRGQIININYSKDAKLVETVSNRLTIPDIDFNVSDFLTQALNNTQWRQL
ncbi:MAG: hypothetical protein WAT37_11700 [Saprospiraceae bacterium]